MDEGSSIYVICDIIEEEDELEENSSWRFKRKKKNTRGSLCQDSPGCQLPLSKPGSIRSDKKLQWLRNLLFHKNLSIMSGNIISLNQNFIWLQAQY